MDSQSHTRLVAALRAQADLAAALHLLEWDQETFMPAGALDSRARQIGTLAALLHARQTDPAFLDLVDDLASHIAQLEPHQAVDVRETKWWVDRRRVLDADLVGERSELHAQARGIWITARRDNDFAALAPFLSSSAASPRRSTPAVTHTMSSSRATNRGCRWPSSTRFSVSCAMV
jgi:carboxypeptidase Taq